jgi:hypothetical protein
MTLPYQPCPGVAKVSLVGNLNGEQCVNTLHFGKDGIWSPVELEGLATNILAWYEDNVLPLIGNEFVLERADAVDLTSVTGSTASVLVTGGAGAVTTGAVPNNVAVAVTFRTAARGRSFRGRNYVPATPRAALASGTRISTTYQGNLAAAYTALLSAPIGSGVLWGVLTRRAGGAPRAEGFITEVTSCTVDVNLDSQRRRLAGRGA